MMSSRVLLIYPKLPFYRRLPSRPPLGILTVAASLVEKGVEVSVLDELVEKDFDEQLLSELKKNPTCVGISSLSGNHIASALRISKLVKENSSTPVVWGGVHASLKPHSTIEHELVDIIVRDDGEERFPKLVDALDSREHHELNQIDGIAYKSNGKIVFSAPPKPAAIEKLPQIPFHLIDFEKYGPEPRTRDYTWIYNPKKIIPMETSRGCPFRCIFCTESMRKKKWRALSPERVINDIKFYIETYGIKNFSFIDDYMFGDAKRGEEIVELLIRENLGIRWYTNMLPRYVVKTEHSFITKLERSGCKMLTFGAESGSKRIVEMVNKPGKPEITLAANRKLAKTSIIPHFVTIRGFPTETRDDIIQTYLLNAQLLFENKNVIISSPFLIVTPSTKIAEICLGDLEKDYNLEDWAKIFDVFKSENAPWVLAETQVFLDKHKNFFSLIDEIERTKGVSKAVRRLILGVYRHSLKHGYSEMLDSLLGTLMNSKVRQVWRASKRTLKFKAVQ